MLPSEAELAALPREARNAFAARCAERVRPLTHLSDLCDPSATVAQAALAILRVSPRPGELVLFRHDFSTIRKLTKANGWTDDTRIPPEVFGPLWPGRIPKWAQETNKPRE